eukprot:6465304-Amphidinium_carterae.3
MSDTPALQDFWQQHLWWARSGFTRELLVSALENEWQSVNHLVLEDLRSFARAFRTSKITEDGFNVLREQERLHKAGRLSRQARWHKLVNHSLMADHERRRVEPSDQDKIATAPTKVPESVFKCSREDCSVASLADDLLRQDAKWSTVAPKNRYLAGFAAHALVTVPTAELARLWPSQCMEVGFVAHEQDNKDNALSLILKSSSLGCLAVRVRARHKQAFKYFELDLDCAEPIIVLHVRSLLRWFVHEVRPLSPACFKALCPGGVVPAGIVYQLVSQGESLRKFASRRAFHTLPGASMDDLQTMLGVSWPKPKPTHVADKVLYLMQQVLTDSTDDELQAFVLKFRDVEARSPWSSALDPQNAELAATVLEQTDADDLRKLVKTRCAKSNSMSHGRAQKLGAASCSTTAASETAATGSKARKKQVTMENLDVAEVRKYIPQIKGACISKDTQRHMRWQVRYPTDAPPYTHSAVWNEHRSESAALQECMRWLWDQHHEACPFEFIYSHEKRCC